MPTINQPIGNMLNGTEAANFYLAKPFVDSLKIQMIHACRQLPSGIKELLRDRRKQWHWQLPFLLTRLECQWDMIMVPLLPGQLLMVLPVFMIIAR